MRGLCLMNNAFLKCHKFLSSSFLTLGCWVLCPAAASAHRSILSLDGQWQIADSKSPTEIPSAFSRSVPVPGLANLATPAFASVDEFYSREHLANRIRAKLAPEAWLTNYWTG